jgi:hypothetical protein
LLERLSYEVKFELWFDLKHKSRRNEGENRVIMLWSEYENDHRIVYHVR